MSTETTPNGSRLVIDDFVPPVTIGEISFDRTKKTGFERMQWLPTEFAANFGRADSVAITVTRTISYEGYLLMITFSI